MVDMTKARAAVYALRSPGVHPHPELTIDRVIGAYCVSDATREHERADNQWALMKHNPGRVYVRNYWRNVVRCRINNMATGGGVY